MKNKFQLLFVLLTIVILSFPSVCFSEMKMEKETEDGWVYYGTTEIGDFYYDKSSMSKGSHQIFTVWDKLKFSDVGKNEYIQWRKNKKMSIDGWGKLDNRKTFSELNCVQKTIKTTRSMFYNNQGIILEDVIYENETTYIGTLGSIHGLFLKTVCK
jgi:hypothetical protein